MSYGRSRIAVCPAPGTIVCTLGSALIASVGFGGVQYATGLVGAVGALYGLDGVVTEGVLVFFHSLAASALFVAGIERLGGSRYAPLPIAAARYRPFVGACVGGVYGTVLWLTVVAHGVPLWLELTTGAQLPTPFRHGASLLALVWFGIVLGSWYPILRDAFAAGS